MKGVYGRLLRVRWGREGETWAFQKPGVTPLRPFETPRQTPRQPLRPLQNGPRLVQDIPRSQQSIKRTVRSTPDTGVVPNRKGAASDIPQASTMMHIECKNKHGCSEAFMRDLTIQPGPTKVLQIPGQGGGHVHRCVTLQHHLARLIGETHPVHAVEQ